MALSERTINGELEIPHWLVTGETVLIPETKEASRREHYRLIACLNTIYKIFTVECFVTLSEHTILPPERFALRKGKRGCTDAPMGDSMVTEDATHRGHSLDVAWINYQKAFDIVPHGWLTEAIKLCKIPDQVQKTMI